MKNDEAMAFDSMKKFRCLSVQVCIGFFLTCVMHVLSMSAYKKQHYVLKHKFGSRIVITRQTVHSDAWMIFIGWPVEYAVVDRMNESGFAVGSDLVPLDEPVLVRHQQRGFFPLLDALIPREPELEVLVTRNLSIAEEWAKQREKEQIEWLGYMIHERPSDLKRGARLAYIHDPLFSKGIRSV